MAPALPKDGHGIHRSPSPTSVRSDSATCSTELESQMKSTDDDSLQMMWQSLLLFPSLDSRLPASPLDTPAHSVLPRCLQESASQRDMVPLYGPASLPRPLSSAEVLRESHQVASVFTGVPDMFLAPEHIGQESRLRHECKAASECGPDGCDVHHYPFTLTRASPLYANGEENNRYYCPVPPASTQEKVAGMGRPPPSSVQPCGDRVNAGQPPSRAVPEEAVKEQLSRQAGLQNRAQGLQRRLQAMLGEHAVLHCNQQLEGLRRHCELGGGSLYSFDAAQPAMLPLQVGCEPRFSWLDESTAASPFTEVEEFSLSSQAALRGLQEALDSEATASSSSDEEQEEDVTHGYDKTSPVGSCEWRWLEERGELGSSWCWLQLRLAELEGRIQQLAELHKYIRSTKGVVVLAESQPLTDEQIQQTLLREMTELSCRALDADPESCSPMRLLHNIERQSAQLSQLVNSLMPPLSLSPLSKQPLARNGKRVFRSGQRGDNAFGLANCKRRRLGTRWLKANVCARTRPLVLYHKPKLFTLSAFNRNSPQDLGRSTSSPSTSSCSCRSSRNPVVLCSDPDCSSTTGVPSSRTTSSTPQPALGGSSETPLCHRFKRAREEWCQRPLVINVEPCGPAHCNRRSSSPLHNNSHKYKQYAGHCKSRVMGLSPFGMAGSAQRQHRRASQRKRKRRHIHRLTEDKEDGLYQLWDLEDHSDEGLKQSYIEITHKQASQGFVRKRQGVSVCNIDDVVVPLSAAKVETLQCKDILTPSWRAVETSPLILREAGNVEDSEEGQTEDLTDEVFAKRHLTLEQREKSCWGSWGKRNCWRPPKRSGSPLSGSGDGMCTSGEESSKKSCAQPDNDEQQSSEEWLPQAAWKRRMFPLDDDDEEALLSDNPEVPSDCHLSPAWFFGATLPSGGQSNSRALSES